MLPLLVSVHERQEMAKMSEIVNRTELFLHRFINCWTPWLGHFESILKHYFFNIPNNAEQR